MQGNLSIWIAFWAGVLSFVSPCTLPLVPSYIGYISGVSFQKLTTQGSRVDGRVRTRAFVHALLFCVGLSFMFIVLGWGATTVGTVLIEYKSLVRLVGGLLVILMGLVMAGVIRSDWLLRERRFQVPGAHRFGYIGSVIVGVAFAAGWTPCIGPILAAVLTMAATNTAVGAWYMVAYAVGFSVPFLIIALTFSSIRPLLRYTERIQRIGGWLLVIMGVLLLTDRMTSLVIWIQRVTGYGGV